MTEEQVLELTIWDIERRIDKMDLEIESLEEKMRELIDKRGELMKEKRTTEEKLYAV